MVFVFLVLRMPNLLVLCQGCFAWVEPHSRLCPECAVEIDLERPDLDRETLDRILGRPLMTLGSVRVDRRDLPSFGELIGTSTGLLFVPRLHRRLNGAWEEVAATRIPSWWPFQGDHTSPRFLSWLRQPLTGLPASHSSATTASQKLDQISLTERLIENPGAFFAERRWIQSMNPRKRMVSLNRAPLRSITLIDETDEGTLYASLKLLSQKMANSDC